MVEVFAGFDIDLKEHLRKRYFQIYAEKTIGNFYWELFCDLNRGRQIKITCTPLKENDQEPVEWECDADVNIELFNQSNHKTDYRKVTRSFSAADDSFCWQISSNDWTNLMVDIAVLIPKKLRIKSMTEEPNVDENLKNDWDVCFIVGGKKVYANKKYLELHSAVFKRMFEPSYGFVKAVQNEFPISNQFSYDSFRTLIRLMLPTSEVVTDQNCEEVAKIGQFYDANSVMQKVENFLLYEAISTTLVKKWVLAEKYQMVQLEIACMARFAKSTKSRVLRMLEDEHMQQLSEKKQLVIYRKLAEIELSDE